jgi:hypothetical protein
MKIEIEVPAIEVYNKLNSDTKKRLDKLTEAYNHFGETKISPEEFLDKLKISPQNINNNDIIRAVTHSTDQMILEKSMELDQLLALRVIE